MLSKNAVRALAALIATLLAVGLLEYAHLNGGSSHLRVSSSSHAPKPGGSKVTRPPHTPHDLRARPPARTSPPPVTGDAHRREQTPSGSGAHDRARHPAIPGGNARGLPYIVQPGDTLWRVAAVHLGNPALWTELFAHNRGRREPGGGALVDPNRIYPGWTIELPAGAKILRSATTRVPASDVLAGAVPQTQTVALVTTAPRGGAR